MGMITPIPLNSLARKKVMVQAFTFSEYIDLCKNNSVWDCNDKDSK